MMLHVIAMGIGAAAKIDVTIVTPCLNEAKWLPACIANAKEALTRIRAELGLNGEILIADNGSADGSQLIARVLGATLVEISQLGYGGGAHQRHEVGVGHVSGHGRRRRLLRFSRMRRNDSRPHE
jgi:glycosyltransferase involved in cell wall biosynthesis